MSNKSQPRKSLRDQVYTIIFGTDTFWGKLFDIILLVAILLSVFAVMLESVESIEQKYGNILYVIEWVFTILFTLEYIARIIAVEKPRRYIFSFYGIIDFLSILPSYLSIFISGSQMLMIIRSIRLIRVFRVFKLVRFLGEASQLSHALRSSAAKIIVFIGSVFIVVVIVGSMMYLIEGRENGFSSIPKSIYWAIVTLTTVGYGDIAPQTVLGQALASFIMILGYGVIAVPTGIVSSEMTKQIKNVQGNATCPTCDSKGLDNDAIYCKNCGNKLL